MRVLIKGGVVWLGVDWTFVEITCPHLPLNLTLYIPLSIFAHYICIIFVLKIFWGYTTYFYFLFFNTFASHTLSSSSSSVVPRLWASENTVRLRHNSRHGLCQKVSMDCSLQRLSLGRCSPIPSCWSPLLCFRTSWPNGQNPSNIISMLLIHFPSRSRKITSRVKLFYYEQQIKRQLKWIHIRGCRCNQRLKAKTDGQGELEHLKIIWDEVNTREFWVCDCWEWVCHI